MQNEKQKTLETLIEEVESGAPVVVVPSVKAQIRYIVTNALLKEEGGNRAAEQAALVALDAWAGKRGLKRDSSPVTFQRLFADEAPITAVQKWAVAARFVPEYNPAETLRVFTRIARMAARWARFQTAPTELDFLTNVFPQIAGRLLELGVRKTADALRTEQEHNDKVRLTEQYAAAQAVPNKRWVEWVEPYGPNNAPVYKRVEDSTAIAIIQSIAAEKGMTMTDEDAFEDFVTVHWGTIVHLPDTPAAKAKPSMFCIVKTAGNTNYFIDGKRVSPETFINLRAVACKHVFKKGVCCHCELGAVSENTTFYMPGRRK